MPDIEERLDLLIDRLRTSYDGIGHSSGRPFVYFVYPPDQERAMRRLADERLTDGGSIRYRHIDLVPLTIQTIAGQEERRQQILNDPVKSAGAADAIMRLWARAVGRAIHDVLDVVDQGVTGAGRPVIVLRGLGALHPLGNPTSLMEAIADQETRDPQTGGMIPIVLLVPGTRPIGSSRTYHFLGQDSLRLQFYRGEEI
jgi:hypothetical protein